MTPDHTPDATEIPVSDAEREDITECIALDLLDVLRSPESRKIDAFDDVSSHSVNLLTTPRCSQFDAEKVEYVLKHLGPTYLHNLCERPVQILVGAQATVVI